MFDQQTRQQLQSKFTQIKPQLKGSSAVWRTRISTPAEVTRIR